jgi:hypothetical protein
MSEETARLPDFWRFVWLFWMQPVTLHRLLRSVGVDPREGGWKLLRRRRSPRENWWLMRQAQMILLFAPGVVLTDLFAPHSAWPAASLLCVVTLGLAAVPLGVAAISVPIGSAFYVAVLAPASASVDAAVGLVFGASALAAA